MNSNAYRSKLRSAKTSGPSGKPDTDAGDNQGAHRTLLPSPQTPPMEAADDSGVGIQDLEQFFPPSPYGRSRTKTCGDRFIPIREESRIRNCQLLDSPSSRYSRQATAGTDDQSTQDRRMEAFFRAEILGDVEAADDFVHRKTTPRRILKYSRNSRSPEPAAAEESPRHTLSTHPFSDAGCRILTAYQRPVRRINTTAIKILDAPDLQDDFYLNLIDWGTTDCLAVGLGTCVYLWNANTSSVTKLCDLSTDAVTSVSWAKRGSYLAVGTNKGRVMLWDAVSERKLRTWTGHTSRAGALAWSSNILTSGGRDHVIFHRDVRTPEAYFRKLTEHTQEVCGLAWNSEGTMLATGGNDNNLIIWDGHHNRATFKFQQHKAAVKAIGWNPHARGSLVSGGGTADKTIKFWNTISGTLVDSHDTHSQVCNVAFSKRTNEIISTHGYASNSTNTSNQVIVWRANTMERVATLSGHSSRVLYLAMNRDGTTVVTGAGDETLRFWDTFSEVSVNRRDPNRQQRLR